MLVAQGDGPGALAAYRKSLAIGEALAARDAANTEWQRDLSVSHEKIGDVLVAQGDGPGALAAYRKSLAIARERWPRAIRQNTEWQRDLSVSHNKIGDVLVAQGDGPGALAAYRKEPGHRRERWPRAIRQNTQWQRDLSVSHEKIGDVLVAQGDGAGALAAYRKSLAIAREPGRSAIRQNTQWQRDLSVSHKKIGDVLVAQGDGAGALAAYRKSLAIRESLAAPIRKTRSGSATYPSVTKRSATCWWRRETERGRWQPTARAWLSEKPGRARPAKHGVATRSLGESHQDRRRAGRAGLGAGASGRVPQEPDYASADLALDAPNTEWQRDLSLIHDRIGDVLFPQGDGPGAGRVPQGSGDPRSAGGARRGQHRLAARSFGKLREDWRRAGGARRRAGGAGRVPQGAGDPRSAGGARCGQHRLAARSLGESRKDR